MGNGEHVPVRAACAAVRFSEQNDDMSPDYLWFWGKAKPEDAVVHAWHPTAYHCLDVAAVIHVLFERKAVTRRRAAQLLQTDESGALGLCRTFALLHDVGKFASGFLANRPDIWPTRVLGDFDGRIPLCRHTEAGLSLWGRRLQAEVATRFWAADVFALKPLILATFGHHGRPLRTQLDASLEDFRPAAVDASSRYVADALSLLCPMPVETILSESLANSASWWVAGLLSTADWVSSRARWFPYHAPTLTLWEYWEVAKTNAARAVFEAGLTPASSAALTTFTGLTRLPHEPSPVQQWAEVVALAEGPTLFVVEDRTGSGKTEAAQMLVHRLMATGRASGAYWAMPTQATANAMYERQRRGLERLFDRTGKTPSLVLAHGQAKLNPRFTQTVLGRDVSDDMPSSTAANDAEDERDGWVECAEWLLDDRRRSLLADIGAGTVDQALIGVLPSKYGTMRLFALAEKVLVLDEVHAYDRYMNEEIKALLQFHAALGGSAVLLTATLPEKLRGELLTAWRLGVSGGRTRSAAPSAGGRSAPFPLTTIVDGTGEVMFKDVASSSIRITPVRFIHSVEEAIDRIVAASEMGAAVAWIRNTVDSCHVAADALRERGIEPVIVFHARFAQCDRQSIEGRVGVLFGPEENEDRRGKVIVATQVIEQSLDLDFDVLISDLAPIDLLIQRLGRLWRHERSDAARPAGIECELVVLAPPFEAEPDKNWLNAELPGTRSVYRNPGVLWRTLRALHRVGQVTSPRGIRDLIEQVYAEEAKDDLPDELRASADGAEAAESANGTLGRQFVLKVRDGYTGDYNANWYSDVWLPTRLGEEQEVVRLARVTADNGLGPWAEDAGTASRQWALSELRVGKRKHTGEHAVESHLASGLAGVRSTWPEYERTVPVLPLSFDGTRWAGRLKGRGEKMMTYEYSRERGLVWGNSEAE